MIDSRRVSYPSHLIHSVHASSGGSGGGETAVRTHSSVALDITDVGFSVHAGTDGVVRLSLGDAFDHAKLKAALAKAGVPADIQEATVVGTWGHGRLPRCVPTPGVTRLDDSRVLRIVGFGTEHSAFEITPSAMPAGSVLAFDLFTSDDEKGVNAYQWALLSGTPGKCVGQMVPDSTTH